MTHEELIARAQEVKELDPQLWREIRSLMVPGGTLLQVVRAVLDLRRDMQDAMTNIHMVSDEAIRRCIGMQGQVLGMNQVLALFVTLMAEPVKAEEAKDGQDVP